MAIAVPLVSITRLRWHPGIIMATLAQINTFSDGSTLRAEAGFREMAELFFWVNAANLELWLSRSYALSHLLNRSFYQQVRLHSIRLLNMPWNLFLRRPSGVGIFLCFASAFSWPSLGHLFWLPLFWLLTRVNPSACDRNKIFCQQKLRNYLPTLFLFRSILEARTRNVICHTA